MNRIIKSIIIIFALSCAVFSVSIYAQNTQRAGAWFFKKTLDHTQPKLDPTLEYIEKYNCAYVDKSRENSTDKVIYLTFDAGYENGNIEKILDTMKQNNVVGSFFILENLINRNPELVKRMADDGHLICNHTARHKDMSRITEKDTFETELKKLETIYTEKIGGEMAKIYRPPEGRFSELNLMHATELGYKTVFWSFAYADWDNKNQMSEDEAVQKIISTLHNGEIMLLHPTSETNARIMNKLISILKEDGYRFETLDKLP